LMMTPEGDDAVAPLLLQRPDDDHLPQ
jgi:hypothetical protein